MKCPKCNKNLAIIHPTFGVVWCKPCQDTAQSYHKGKPLNFTDSSDRIKKQREEHRDDFLQPHAYNKASKKLEINREFVDKYPDKAHLYFTNDEMIRAGYSKLAKYNDEVKSNEAREKQKIEAFKQKVIEYRESKHPSNIGEFLKKL